MRIFHIGDLHLGKVVNGFSQIEDQRYILSEIIALINEYQPDVLIMAGDIYDKSIPSLEAVSLFDEFISQLNKIEQTTLIISGNHDSKERLSFARQILKERNIIIVSEYSGSIEKEVLDDEYGEVNFYLLPFVRPSEIRKYDEEVTSYQTAITSAITNTELDYNKRNVFVGHQFYAGSSTERSDSEISSVGGIDIVSYESLTDFDYAALGHLHKAQQLNQEYIRYSGSILKYSLSEVNHNKSLVMIDLANKGKRNITLLPLVPTRAMIHVKDFLNNILADNKLDTKAYVHVTLLDDNEIIDVVGKLRAKFPYLMSLHWDNVKTNNSNMVDPLTEHENKEPYELFEDFFVMQNNKELSQWQQEYIKHIMEEVLDNETK